MTFDQTKAKRKKFVELFKKYRDLVILEALTYKEDSDGDGDTEASWIRHILSNQSAPAVLWDTAENDDRRSILFNALSKAISVKQTELYDEISTLDALKTELFQIPDEDDDDDDSLSVNAVNIFADSYDDNNEVTTLYHATPRVNIPSVEQSGLLTMQRQHVFFWEDEQEAINVASRHGDPDIAVIKADKSELEEAGYSVEQEDFGYGPQWCVRGNVPAKYLVFPKS